MALLRAELKGAGRVSYQKQAGENPKAETRGIYEGVLENASDLALARLETFDPGSMVYCLENGGFYVKNSQGSWVSMTN